MAVKNEFDTEDGETAQYDTNCSTLSSDGLDDASEVRGIEKTGTAVVGTKSHTTTPSASGTHLLVKLYTTHYQVICYARATTMAHQQQVG